MDFERYVAEKEYFAALNEKKETTARIVRGLIKKKIPIEDIAEATNLTVEEVSKLLKETEEEHS